MTGDRIRIRYALRGTGAFYVQDFDDVEHWIEAVERAYNATLMPHEPARFLMVDHYTGERDFGLGEPFGRHTCVFAWHDATSNQYRKDRVADVYVERITADQRVKWR